MKHILLALFFLLPASGQAQSVLNLKNEIDSFSAWRPVPLSVGQLQTLSFLSMLCDSIGDTLGSYVQWADTPLLVTPFDLHQKAVLTGGNTLGRGFSFGTVDAYPDSNLVHTNSGKILGAVTDTFGAIHLASYLTGSTGVHYAVTITDTAHLSGSALGGGIAVYKTTDSEGYDGYDMLDLYNDSTLVFRVTEYGDVSCTNVACLGIDAANASISGTVVATALTYTIASEAAVVTGPTGTQIIHSAVDHNPALSIIQQDTTLSPVVCNFIDGNTIVASITQNGSIVLAQPGAKLTIDTGYNASVGAVLLSSGAATVYTSAVTSTSRIFITAQSCAGCAAYSIGTIVPGISFIINSTNSADASKVAWWIIN